MEYAIKTREMKARRIRQGYSQKDLAEKSGLQQSVIATIETGARVPRPGTLKKIADALCTPADELITLDEER